MISFDYNFNHNSVRADLYLTLVSCGFLLQTLTSVQVILTHVIARHLVPTLRVVSDVSVMQDILVTGIPVPVSTILSSRFFRGFHLG